MFKKKWQQMLMLIVCVLFLFFVAPDLSSAQKQEYPWERALETQLGQLSKPQDVYVVHLGIRDRDEEAYHVAQTLSKTLGRPTLALPSYTGDPTQDLRRAVTQYLNSQTYPVRFDQAWERILARGHRIVGTVFHSGAGIRANTERDRLVAFIKSNPGKVTGNTVFVTTDLKGTTVKSFGRVGIPCIQVGKEDFVSWATKPAAQYIPFGEYLGPPATALGWALKGPAIIGKDLSKHALLSRQTEVAKALQGTATTAPLETGGIDLSSVELRYFSEYQEGPIYVQSAALHATPAETGRGINLDRASELSWNSLYVWLALHSQKFWVNLNPAEPNRIVDPELGKTDVGRILLEADLQMKTDIGRLIHPKDSSLGRQFWDRLYDYLLSRASATGSMQIAIPVTFRVWITPGEVTVWANEESIYIVDAQLDVKLESEHLSASSALPSLSGVQLTSDPETQKFAEGLLKQMILPALMREVNTGPQYRELRQVFYSRVIAEWYKKKHMNRLAFEKIIREGKVDPWRSREPWSAQTIFQRYVDSYNRKIFDITEESETISGQYVIRTVRRYIFGGVDFTSLSFKEISYQELLKRNPAVNEQLFNAVLTSTGQWGNERWIGGTYVAGIPEEVSILNVLRDVAESRKAMKIKGMETLIRRRI